MSVTPNMNLILPTVSSTPGPEYATEQNTAMSTIDAHDHTSGNGVQIPSAGIGIDADFQINGYNITEPRTVRFQDQDAALGAATDVACVYSAGGNLFFNDSSGTQIQLTAGGALNAASIGGIGGDYATSSASVYYQSIDSTFYFTSNTNTPATINAGSIIVREPVVSSNAITVKTVTSLGASYDLTLPSALPASTKVVFMSSSGALSTNTIATGDINDSAITTAKIDDLAVTTAKIAALAVTTAKLDASAVTTAKITDYNVTPVKLSAPNRAVSADSGNYSTASSSYVDPTNNITGSFTPTGQRAVLVSISSYDSGNPAVIATATGDANAYLLIKRSSTEIAQFGPFSEMTSLTFVDWQPANATYTYSYQVKVLAGDTVSVKYMKIQAVEM